MNSIIVATICALFITFSEADIKEGSLPNIPARVTDIPLLANIIDACLLMGKANYSVSSMSLDSPQVGGCVHFNVEKAYMEKTFNLWLGNSKQQCGQEDSGMEEINFSCDEYPKTSTVNNNDGTKFVRLYGQDVNKTGVESIRCALFEKDGINSTIFRLAVSGNNSCSGLAELFEEKLSTIPEGSNFLRLTRDPEHQEHQSRDRRSVANATSTVQNQDWSTVWMLG
ncbi:uncharacterized protein LOC100573363 [Acyrthosiphon pisum]|uniref:Secreted protein n=1 Tax=Acyrthosiphon pisum TaxID=7029 RepID=A0A8R2AHB1_ACYPI|nr:uncharacterized protein LOC100573363 [Acyrthosiphon pisum]|eukprot:XP_003245690.1 PREDICTED: uncharacterized protein LOC100573363 [Acyrthosiphon pisum]